MPQPFTQFRPPVPRHVGLPRLPMPSLVPCRFCGALRVVGRVCPCQPDPRPCGADDLDPVDLDEYGAGD